MPFCSSKGSEKNLRYEIVAKQCNLRKRNILGISRGSNSGPSFKTRRLQKTVRERVKCNITTDVNLQLNRRVDFPTQTVALRVTYILNVKCADVFCH